MRVEFFGQFLLNRDLIDPMQLTEAVKLQEKLNLKIGQLFKSKNLLDDKQLENILALQKNEDLFFGEAVEKLNYINKEKINEVLKDMIRRCDKLDLRVNRNDKQLMPEMTACLTMLVMNKLHSGGFHFAL